MSLEAIRAVLATAGPNSEPDVMADALTRIEAIAHGQPDPGPAEPIIRTFDISLYVSVNDPAALWVKAKEYLVGAGSMEPDATTDTIIGSEQEPNVGACLAVLLDRSEHLDGAETEGHSVEETTS